MSIIDLIAEKKEAIAREREAAQQRENERHKQAVAALQAALHNWLTIEDQQALAMRIEPTSFDYPRVLFSFNHFDFILYHQEGEGTWQIDSRSETEQVLYDPASHPNNPPLRDQLAAFLAMIERY